MIKAALTLAAIAAGCVAGFLFGLWVVSLT